MSTVSAILFRRVIQLNGIRQVHLSARIYQERYFTKKHEWVQLIDTNKKQNEVRIGISDYAQRALGDVVYCELPAIGTKLKCDETFATLESVKAVSDCYMPVDGEISSVNEKLKSESDLINKSPYENGWLIQAIVDDKIKNDISTKMMNEKKYNEYLETNKEAGDH
jgi:glycine cleavage system H protein